MNKKPKKTNEKDLEKLNRFPDDLGVDQDEQAMNGDYGMLETEEEDRARDRKK